MFKNSTMCKVCGGDFFSQPLVAYSNVPNSAQGFLDAPNGTNDVVNLVIYQCQNCGLVQHNLPPVGYYKDVIRAIAYSPEMREFRLKQIGGWIAQYHLGRKRILEVGCGKGEYLDLLRASGAESVFGIENSVQSVAIAGRQGFDAKPGYLSSDFSNPWNDKFDAFAIFSFMEHWPDINTSLRQLNKLLNDGAVGLIEVPNFEFIFNNGMYSEFMPDHIYYFDRQTLRTVLEINGFEVVIVDSIWHNYILSAQVKKKSRLLTGVFVSKQEKLVDELQHYVRRFPKQEIVVWGAGHQALTVMSLANMQDHVSHVIDSAPFKQGKFTPGTHLLIKNPESIKEDKPQAIIVMAAAYSDEVVRLLRSSYSEIRHIAVLRADGVELVRNG